MRKIAKKKNIFVLTSMLFQPYVREQAATMLLGTEGREMETSIRELRQSAGLSQIRLAKKSGVPRSRIQSAEAGDLQLRGNELQSIKKALRPALEKTLQRTAALASQL